MELKLIDASGNATTSVLASDELFGRDYNEALIHQVVTAFQANARSASSAQKGRSEINKSTKKPWRQKGTGRARVGRASSPLWRGGGKIFPNGPEENYSQKINRKMYRAGIAAILSQLVREGRLSIIEDLKLETPKTKALVQKIRGFGFDRVMIVTDKMDENLYLSSRNLHNVFVTDVAGANPVSLIYFPQVVMTREAVKKIEEVLV